MSFSNKAANEYIKHNTYLLMSGSFLKPNIFSPKETVGVIKELDVLGLLIAFKADCERLIAANEEHRAYYESTTQTHVCNLSKRSFVTTPSGLFLINEHVFKKDDYYDDHGLKVVWPETTMNLIKSNVIPDITKHHQLIAKTTNESIKTFRLNVELKEKERELKLIERQVACKKLADFLGTKNEDLYKSLMEYDFFYSYSDDHSVYRAGVNKEKELSALLVERGFDSKVVFSLVNKARS